MCLIHADLYHALGNPQGEAESYRMHDSFSQMLLKDHFQSTQLSEHRLIQVALSINVCSGDSVLECEQFMTVFCTIAPGLGSVSIIVNLCKSAYKWNKISSVKYYVSCTAYCHPSIPVCTIISKTHTQQSSLVFSTLQFWHPAIALQAY